MKAASDFQIRRMAEWVTQKKERLESKVSDSWKWQTSNQTITMFESLPTENHPWLRGMWGHGGFARLLAVDKSLTWWGLLRCHVSCQAPSSQQTTDCLQLVFWIALEAHDMTEQTVERSDITLLTGIHAVPHPEQRTQVVIFFPHTQNTTSGITSSACWKRGEWHK